MTQSDQTNTKKSVVGLSLSADLVQRLDELAAGAGMRRTRFAAALLEEIVPTIAGAAPRRGLAINFRPGPSNGTSPPVSIKRAAGTPFEQAGGR